MARLDRAERHVPNDRTAGIAGRQSLDHERDGLARHQPRSHRSSTSARKNGTPISDVTSPIGRTIPGTIVLLRHEARDITQRARQRAARQKKSMVLSDQQAGDMRANQADEGNRPDESDGRAGENADPQEREEAQPHNVDAETACAIRAKAQRRELPGRCERERQNARDHDQENPVLLLIGSRQAAEGPEHELLQRLLACDELHDGDQGIEGEEQRDAEKHQGFPAAAAQARQ